MDRNLVPFPLQVVSLKGWFWVPFCSQYLLMTYIPFIVSSSTFTFADDTLRFIRSSDDYATLQNDLNLATSYFMHEWSVCWHLNV